jgi:hypothetical protein
MGVANTIRRGEVSGIQNPTMKRYVSLDTLARQSQPEAVWLLPPTVSHLCERRSWKKQAFFQGYFA